MLTRRSFAGLTSWVICAVAGFVETDALAAEEAPRAGGQQQVEHMPVDRETFLQFGGFLV